jgi:hypothetical protein
VFYLALNKKDLKQRTRTLQQHVNCDTIYAVIEVLSSQPHLFQIPVTPPFDAGIGLKRVVAHSATDGLFMRLFGERAASSTRVISSQEDDGSYLSEDYKNINDS